MYCSQEIWACVDLIQWYFLSLSCSVEICNSCCFCIKVTIVTNIHHYDSIVIVCKVRSHAEYYTEGAGHVSQRTEFHFNWSLPAGYHIGGVSTCYLKECLTVGRCFVYNENLQTAGSMLVGTQLDHTGHILRFTVTNPLSPGCAFLTTGDQLARFNSSSCTVCQSIIYWT